MSAKRDPNKFCLNPKCKGCNKMWDVLTQQDEMLERLAKKIRELEVKLEKK